MLSQAITQSHLEQVVHEIFRSEHIVVNARKKGEVRNPNTGYFLELDIWIPKLKLAFEFQDAYHYATTWYNQNPLSDIKLSDYKKSEYIAQQDITLVCVPCWWDSSAESLMATISFLRPDISLLSRNITPIPLSPPAKFFGTFSVPDVGEMMLASFFESSLRFGESISPTTPWWLGEKYDGIRCIWNPRTKKLYNKTGIELQLPVQHVDVCLQTSIFLDGEIWCGRGLYVEALKILGANDINWAYLKMVVFDNPGRSFQEVPFERRYLSLLTQISSGNPFLIVAFRILCKTYTFMQKGLHVIIREGGGEGVIMRKPKSLYTKGRSANLVKIKASRGDTEALVVSIDSNHIAMQMPNGVMFEMETKESKVVPKKGEIVTLAYESYSRKSAPVNPTLVRIRTDLRWEDVVADFISDAQYSDTYGLSNISYTTKHKGYWTAEKGNKIRKYLEEYARSKDLDPLLPDTWYSISGSFVADQKSSMGIFSHQGGYIKALLELFPEIGIDEKMFPKAPAGYWESTQNRKQLFMDFADEHNFDALIADNWYNARDSKDLDTQAAGILPYYQGSVVKALLHLFPDIGFEESKFSNLPKGYWSNTENRKIFFDGFAKEKGFDALIARNWYSITWRDIKNAQGKSLLKYYDGQSVAAALFEIYPNIGLERTQFSLPNNYWSDPQMRKSFFDNFAAENCFDPLLPDNWYSVSSKDLRNTKSYSSVLQYYKGGIIAALMACYPNIGLDKSKFQQKRKEKIHFDIMDT